MMRFAPLLSLAVLPVLALAQRAAAAETPLDYERDVKPVLEQHCFNCHGPEKQKAGLRLDVKANVLKGGDSGEPTVVPGSSLKSHLVKVLLTDDPEQVMPPKGERLKPAEVALLQRWVDGGAHWVDAGGAAAKETDVTAVAADAEISAQDRAFWSFVPPQAGEPPRVSNERWARNAIDRYVLAKLESRGLHPSAEADRAVLIRRLTYDLTGLPPTPEDVAAFLTDTSPDAYEKVVDRLLGSPRFGERMASFWLPLARYAEDQAHQVGSDTKLTYPYAWRYREWVINAFNRDVPYDRFITLQLAADKVPGASADDQPALGFLGLGPKYYNRGRIEVMADEWEDRVDTVSRTTLGLTVACARCHDHKFDPISARDYYALAGVFASTRMVHKTLDGKSQRELKAEELLPTTIHVVEDGEVQDLNLFIRGNVTRKGPVVPRHFLTVLSKGTPKPLTDGSGRRELAEAIASRENPLTARVMVNRLWGLVFGTPIVATPSNFGHSGMLPTNPALLDALAVRFMDGGWSVKGIVREMVCSSTYRQNARASAAGAKADPGNECYWRMNRRRLTVEQWRDGVLFAVGQLQLEGGKSVEADEASNDRRTVYSRISRMKLNDLLMQFDYPDANVHAERRSVTNTPIQKLFALNSGFMIAQAKALAARVDSDTQSGDDAARVTRAYQLLFARPPAKDELKLGLAFLKKPAASPELSRWAEYAQVLLACNEALYVD